MGTHHGCPPTVALTSCENGMIYCGDTRQPGKVAFSISAHESPVSALAMSAHVPGLLVSGASEQSVRVWDVRGSEPAFIASHVVPDMVRT